VVFAGLAELLFERHGSLQSVVSIIC